MHTLGLEPPANPALVEHDPTSITMGWFNNAAARAPLLPSAPACSVPLLILFTAFFDCSQHNQIERGDSVFGCTVLTCIRLEWVVTIDYGQRVPYSDYTYLLLNILVN